MIYPNLNFAQSMYTRTETDESQNKALVYYIHLIHLLINVGKIQLSQFNIGYCFATMIALLFFNFRLKMHVTQNLLKHCRTAKL